MDEWIERLEALTSNVLNELDKMEAQDFEYYVNQRQSLIDEMKKISIDSSQKEVYSDRVKKLLSYDEQILNQMHLKLLEAKQGLNKLRTAKTQRNVYESNYSSESFFFDRKK
ncbi:hypothetical protein [Marinicrinis lubricantis]|uniref:Flagellar protein FliT n=1 Tax=Marinicrinis lubricantis TaxID=2086470 RepID=A0ABW1IT08_9BACL